MCWYSLFLRCFWQRAVSDIDQYAANFHSLHPTSQEKQPSHQTLCSAASCVVYVFNRLVEKWRDLDQCTQSALTGQVAIARELGHERLVESDLHMCISWKVGRRVFQVCPV